MRTLPSIFCMLLLLAACGGGGGGGADDVESPDVAADTGAVDVTPEVKGDAVPDTDPCSPACAGLVCGEDPCGNFCGECEEGFACEEGACVEEAPGDFEVSVEYYGAVPISNIRVQLYADVACAEVSPTNIFGDPLSEKVVPELPALVAFEGLATGQSYTAIGLAEGPTGVLTAAGCKDGLEVLTGSSVPAKLELYLLGLEADGAFQWTDTLDLTAVGNVLGGIEDSIQKAFGDVTADYQLALGGWTSGLVSQGTTSQASADAFLGAAAAWIGGWVQANHPAGLADLETAVEQLIPGLGDVQLLSSADLLVSGITATATLTRQSMAFTFDWGCGAPEDPDYAACAYRVWTAAELVEAGILTQPTAGWSGGVSTFDKLTINNHKLRLSPTALVGHLLGTFLLPIVQAPDYETLLAGLMDCDTFVTELTAHIQAMNVTPEDATQICEEIKAQLRHDPDDMIAVLDLPGDLRLSGIATLHEEDSDLLIDEVQNGQYEGYLVIDGDEGDTITGTFTATPTGSDPAE